MKASISQSNIAGKATAPSSKSYTIRGLLCSAFAPGESRILSPLGSDDTVAAMNVLRQVGVSIKPRKSWTVTGGNFQSPTADLFCGDSATTFRFMMAAASVIPGNSRLTAGQSLSRRPVQPLIDALQHLGIICESNGGLPPVTVRGGKFTGGTTSLPGDISSQFVSALLFVAPLSEKGVTVRLTTPLESRPYVMMTMDTMQYFGITVAFNDVLDEFEVIPQKYKPTRFRVEGDWSSASYLLALGALAGGVQVDNLPSESLQGDRMILNFLTEMGADIKVSNNSVIVKKSNLRPIKADLTDCIDLLPTMGILAGAADGVSQLGGIERARIKESDRVTAVARNLLRMGIPVSETADTLSITGGQIRGAVIDSHNDHRIAMAFSLLGTIVGNTIIEEAECVNKTYPEFWQVLKSLGGRVEINE